MRKGFSSQTVEIYIPNPKIKKPFRPTAFAVVEVCDEEQVANAQLMLASPDLLEALESAIEDYAETGMISDVTLNKMETVRSKAKGETP